jgi:hypothetical protein
MAKALQLIRQTVFHMVNPANRSAKQGLVQMEIYQVTSFTVLVVRKLELLVSLVAKLF